MGRHKKEVIEIDKKIADINLNNETNKEPNIVYYMVVYLDDGTVHAWPGKSKEDCKNHINKIKETKWKSKIKYCRVIKRNLSNYENGYFL